MTDAVNLPDSWVQVTVTDLGRVVSGGTPSTKENSYWSGDISWISPSDLTGYSNKYITKGAKSITQQGLKNSSATSMPAGSIHFSSRAPIGYTVISSCDMTTNQGFKSLVPAQGVFNEYIYYYLKSAKQLAESNATGTTFKEISGAAFSKLPVPLPPTEEQHRIVAKIEELFSDLDKGIENLKTARAQLKVYRQALLKHAFEGKLTVQWRAENPGKLETAAALLKRIQHERAQRYQQQLDDWEVAGKQGSKPKAPKSLPPLTVGEQTELPELPKGWGWVRLASIVTVISGYAFKSGDFVSSGVPVVKIANVGYSEFVDKDQEYLDSSFLFAQKDFIISPDDFLLALTRPITNNKTKVCRYPKGAPVALLNQRVSAMKEVEINHKFLYSYFGTSLFKESIRSKFSETLQPNLSPKDLEACPIPICSLAEQVQIFFEIEARLSEVDQLDQTITTALQQAEALRQSILKKAFSGQLVPQDPQDEPASKLLARIKAERTDVAARPRKNISAKRVKES